MYLSTLLDTDRSAMRWRDFRPEVIFTPTFHRIFEHLRTNASNHWVQTGIQTSWLLARPSVIRYCA